MIAVFFCGIIIIIALVTTSLAIPILLSEQQAVALAEDHELSRKAAPMATSGDNVYVVWWSNKTGNDEIIFKASTDGGKTFGDKMNLSSSANSESQDAQIAASDNNVYVTWWERNQTMNEPVMGVSNDDGKSFGQLTILSEK